MSGVRRTASGGRIDRSRSLSFTFDGKRLQGCAGDTLASALIANDIHLVGRSFKYHRPRGILTAGAEEPNALVTVDRGGGRITPNLRATQVTLYDGLVARSQNRWPSLSVDIGAVNDKLPAGLFAAGFYYKTFMGPGRAWERVFEPLIRRAAGLGKAPKSADPDHYSHRYAHCDVLVVGAGAAGLAAAEAAASCGARVVLCDEQDEAGGWLLSERSARIDERPATLWGEEMAARLGTMPNVRILTRTQAFGYYAQNFLGLAQRVTDHLASLPAAAPRERLWKVRARQVVLATGAFERPLVFPANDRPGVMLASAVQTYANRYGALAGRRAVFFATDDSAYAAAHDLQKAGVEIVLVADARSSPGPAAAALALSAGIPVMPRTIVISTGGRNHVSSARLGRLSREGVEELAPVECDLVAMSGGWTPNIGLFSQSRGKLHFDEERQLYLPGTPQQAVQVVGSANGTFGLGAVIGEGAAAGLSAAQAAGCRSMRIQSVPKVEGGVTPSGGALGAMPHPYDKRRVKAFVDFQNDVTAKDVALAVQEGFHSIEHVKRYTTTGMATDQGKTSNMNALAIAAGELGRSLPDVGLTTFRPPYTPVTFGTFAGHSRGKLFDPERLTPTHGWAERAGAVFEDVGLWKRARYFPRPGENMSRAVDRECRAVRAAVGMFDASTLGKIEVVGPDAAEFLNRLYTSSWQGLAVGRCRYGLMLSEAGFVMDDGVVGRIAADRFHVTTTTGGAARVLAHMEDYLQTEFTELKVWLTSTTEQWGVVAIQGPRGRDVVAALTTDIDVSAGAMPHMSVRSGTVCGAPARVFRVSFTGEVGYEINVPSDRLLDVWLAVEAAGKPLGILPYGTEAMHVLRAEKGYIIVGQETDGTVTPDDLGLGWTIAKAKRDFVGKRALLRPDLVAKDRKQLVGLLTTDPTIVLEEGAQIVGPGSGPAALPALGHVTSSYHSAAAGRSIALALVCGGRGRIGETLRVPMPGGDIAVKVVPPVFYDAEGARIHV
jgi:sarcosine oxidase subunit alpha